MILGFDLALSTFVFGAITGLTYAVFAAGFVLVYRSTGVLNFAQGEIGSFAILLMALLKLQYGVPYWIAFVLTTLACAVIGLVIELGIVRRLFAAPRLVLLIATLGVAQLIQYAKIEMPDIEKGGDFPLPFKFDNPPKINGLPFTASELLVVIIVPIFILALALFITRTRFGLAVRATASNPDTARIYGISVKQTSSIVWVIAAAFAAACGILIAPLQSITANNAKTTTALSFALLSRALLVGLIARMRSLPMTLVGGIVVGIVEKIIRDNVPANDRDIVEIYFLVAILVIVVFTRWARSEEASWSLSPKLRPIPERLKHNRLVRLMPSIGFVVVFAVLAIIPLVKNEARAYTTWTQVVLFAMLGLSLSLLTGWAGQLSLGQYTLFGLGALTTIALRVGNDIPVPFNLFDIPKHRFGWMPAVVIATAFGVVVAFVIGLPALRVKGLFLTVATVAFSVAAGGWMFKQAVFLGRKGASATPRVTPRVEVAGFEVFNQSVSGRKNFYYVCLVLLAIVALIVARLRRTGVGRSMIAVRDNEDAAAASTVSPNRMKLVAFALSGGIASFAGSLFVTQAGILQPESVFSADKNIQPVATAIIGGLGSVAGPIIGSLWVTGLPSLFENSEQVQFLSSSIGLLVLLLYFPGGLMQLVYQLRDAVLSAVDRRMAEAGVAQPIPPIAKAVPTRGTRTVSVDGADPWLKTEGVSVRFGGNRAVNNVSIEVFTGELVGLIGTNGAGKTTLMNAISGFVPATGTINVLGHRVDDLVSYRRHRLGLGRTFQAARLYPDLTVREALMVALEAREKSYLVPSLTGIPPSRGAERRKRDEASQLIDYLGLGRYADHLIANLSTGTRRIVELGSLIAVDAKVLLLDEPTGGVAQKETEAFGPLIKRVQRELGAAVLLIEHDMPLVMSISDRVYCLEAGEVIAHGSPQEVRNDPIVIASYLGTDERAIMRSDA